MEILWIILGLLGLFIVVTLIRAAFFKESKKENVALEPEMVNMDKYCQDLSDAIKIKTISNYDRELVDRAMEIAKARELPAQLKRYVSGGNDAGHIHKALEGVKALAISVPTRYLHSPACVASLDDYESVRDLAEAIMRDIYNS